MAGKRKRCQCGDADCDSRPSFNVKGSKKPRFCALHKEAGMVNVKDRTCEDPDCDRQPTFNVKGNKKRRFCAQHKEAGMVNVSGKICEDPDCDRQPAYNLKGIKKPRFCAQHKEAKMIDVKNRTCRITRCPRYARFGFPGRRPHLCTTHREAGTILQPTKRCLDPLCNELAIYGIRVHEHCETHRIPGEVNILEQACKTCGLLGIVDKAGNCETCDPDTFKRVALAKQNMVRDYLLQEGFVFHSVDRMIDGGACGRERPDFYIDCGTHVLIIEVDEHQHSGRACECEQARMVNISQSNGMPTIFLRWNPDKYKTHAKGIQVEATFKRLAVLKEWARHHMTHAPNEFLSVMYLYFDGYQYGTEKLETILAGEGH